MLLVSFDTTRADHLGPYGGKAGPTPAFDTLAREGTLYRDCTAAAATTLAAHTSIVTGDLPRTHGVPRNGFVLDPANVTLAERLGGLGFWCAAFLGSFALDRRFGFDQGFDHFDQDFDVGVGAAGADQDQRSAERVTAAALAHVDVVRARRGFERDGRLFLFVHYFDPHAPYVPAGGHAPPGGTLARIGAAVEAQQRAALGAPLGVAKVVAEGLTRELADAPPATPTDEDRALAALYAGEVRAMDAALGQLLVGLEARGLLADTLVVVTADHGETFWEHPNFWNHGLGVHQTDVHVPLVLRGPGVPTGHVVAAPVSHIDIAPTVLALLGAPVQGEGLDLRPTFLQGPGLPERALFTEATQPGPKVEPSFDERSARWWNDQKPRAARLGSRKYIRAPYLGLERLYDLERDPGELRDLSAEPSEAAHLARLRAALDGYDGRAQVRASRFDPTQSADTVRRLQALGYSEAGH